MCVEQLLTSISVKTALKTYAVASTCSESRLQDACIAFIADSKQRYAVQLLVLLSRAEISRSYSASNGPAMVFFEMDSKAGLKSKARLYLQLRSYPAA